MIGIKKKTLRYLLSGIAYLSALAFALEYYWSALNVHGEIVAMIYILAIINFVLIYHVQNLLMRLMMVMWQLWMVVGILNVTASMNLYPYATIEVEFSSEIYQLFLLAFAVGVLLYENISRVERFDFVVLKNRDVNKVWLAALIAFPFLLFIEVYMRLGFIPLLSGSNIVDTMYTINYGRLYSYKLVILFSSIYVIDRILISSQLFEKMLFGGIFLSIVFISVIDAKRVILLAVLMAIIVLMLKVKGPVVLRRTVPIISAIMLVTYVAISVVRSDTAYNYETEFSLDRLFYSFGVEYRDYSWAMTRFDVGEIPGYSWVLSSIASFVNRGLLNFLGVDKETLVAMGSANTWSSLFNIDLGIRTGIISELWFEFGYIGMVVMALFGWFISYYSRKLLISSEFRVVPFYIGIYVFSFMLIMGQSTVYFGVLITIIYLYVVLRIFELMFRPNKVKITTMNGGKVRQINSRLYDENSSNNGVP